MPNKKKSRGREKKKPALSATPAIDLETLQGLLSQIGHFETDEALDAAQDLVFDAWETSDPRQRLRLAKQALEISPLCADAYLLLAEAAETPEKAIALYRQAVETGERALGAAAFEEDVGNFWGLIQTRPYMRARHMLAMALWQAGERDEALVHWRDLLRLNPNDNQGVRYVLLQSLLEIGGDDEAGELMERYKGDASAEWAWSKALLTFRRKGDCATSRAALARAVKVNCHVPAYLFSKKRLPKSLPDYVGFGDKNEAVAYVCGAAAAWAATAGALDWAESVAGSEPKRKSEDSERLQIAQAVSEQLDPALEEVDDAVLALLLLGLHKGERVWKSFDWNAMHRLHQKGYISNPVGKAKSVIMTKEGLERAESLFERLFPKAAALELQRDPKADRQ